MSAFSLPTALVGCTPGLDDSVPASEESADLARAWMDEAVLLVKARGDAPPVASRTYGYAGLALQAAVLPGAISPVPGLPAPEDAPHDWPAAAHAALAATLSGLMPEQAEAVAAFAADNDPASEDDDPEVIARSVAYGEAVAAAVLAWAGEDGFAEVGACNSAFEPPLAPEDGGWVGEGTGALPCWGSLRPVRLSSPDACAPAGPPPFSTEPGSTYYAAADEVYRVTGDAGAALTADQAAIAKFWADGPGATGTPPGHWVGVTGTLLAAGPDDLETAALAYARVGAAVQDAFIACWHTKYLTYTLRPITYIQENIDPSWDPLLTTPNFPSYTSGHSTQSMAAAAVLARTFGDVAFEDDSHERLNPELGFGVRAFPSVSAAAEEAAISRLYGGIHYRFDNEDGGAMGACVAEQIDF